MAEGEAVGARVELTGKCSTCFSPDGVFMGYGEHYDYLCAKCAQGMDLREQAEKHLVDYLPAALQAWKEHWLARGLTPLACADALEGAAHEVYEVMREEGIKARDRAKEPEST